MLMLLDRGRRARLMIRAGLEARGPEDMSASGALHSNE